jgi:hypothetical protein
MGSNWQDQDDVEPTVDEAIAHVVSLFATYDEQSKYIQKRLDYFAAQQGPKIFKQYEDKLRERNQQDEAKAQAARRLKAQERKRIRDIAIPEWCEANLKPGMVIMVKASNTKMRQVEKITPGKTYPNGHHFTGSVTGRHVLFGRSRDPETNEIVISLQKGDYITDHILWNVTGVVTGADKRGQPIVIPIMDLVEGRQHLGLDNA